MELHNLKPAKGSTHYRRRLGRGPGSGLGGTSTRGHKGAKSRSGYSKKLGFEGGQMPLQRRVPKYGFKNINRKEYKSINVRTIQYLVDKLNVTDFTPEVLYNAGLVGKHDLVKVLGDGELKAKVNVKAHAFSKKAKEAIEAAQGTAEEL
ncbi:50S ribosomal protein L15 [Anaerophaga thermohalophila]|jgi:large subunit ribosomal protein L15|uniref:50S ribosomal protein L15 n=1 Tax=Anaerophaga thermohalophila TaxID=177400 RepID=UPI0002EE2A4B|nr:50S ribosomal protein L15 [Anaerophaga thermohalophila]